MRPFVSSRDGIRGGVLGYPLPALYEEVAFIAYHFHWPVETVLNMPHSDRRVWVEQISEIHRRRNDEADHAAN
jgi:hypothetical protein